MPTLAWPWTHDSSLHAERAPRVVSNTQLAAIPGWFSRIDIALFRLFLGEQVRQGEEGDLAELGVFLGASAALIGAYRQPGETFTVVDLFGDSAPDAENDAENRTYYGTLSQDAFEANYRGVHGDLPVVIRGTSSTIRTRAARGQHRFVHVDASHEYLHVREDIETARELLAPNGIVVFDDFRSEYFPAVGAAVWPELAHGLVPLALSPEKLYATWGDAERWQRPLCAWPDRARVSSRVHTIAGHPVLGVLSERSRLGEFVPPVLAPVAIRARKLLRF